MHRNERAGTILVQDHAQAVVEYFGIQVEANRA
jgi:hypothetical protein